MLPSFEFEKNTGIDWFASSSPGIEGKLRLHPEDFIVDEIGEPRPGENVCAMLIKHTNWESNALKSRICRDMGLQDRDVSFAGTKDKRAVVTQWVTLKRRTPPHLDIERVEVLEARPSSALLRKGEHDGNHFNIKIRNTVTTEEETVSTANTVFQEIQGHWPNFFGIQRFGAYRSVTHITGRALVMNSAKDAVMTYLGFLGNTTGEERDARKLLEQGASWEDMLQAMPFHLGFERKMIRHLCKREEDFQGALLAIPHGLRQMIVHSFQSYLFNRILSKRMEKGLPIHLPVDGDLICPPTARLKGGKPRFIPVSKSNLAAAAKAVEQGKGWVTAPLPGFDTPHASGEPGEIEKKIMEEEKVGPEDFRITHMPEMASRGTRRSTHLEPKAFSAVWDDSLLISFSLPSGGYATTVLREIMKSPDPLVY